jgi:hypothetical protein
MKTLIEVYLHITARCGGESSVWQSVYFVRQRTDCAGLFNQAALCPRAGRPAWNKQKWTTQRRMK